MKVKWLVIFCMFLLLGLGFVSFGSSDVASAQEIVETTVTYDYYVRAGYEMVPTLPDPAPSPLGFNFTVEAFKKNLTGLFPLGTAGYNFGSITKVGRLYLLEGIVGTTYGSAYARVNITNLLPYDITITNLTAEVTDGTPTKPFYFSPAGMWFGNYTLVYFDQLDPWNEGAPRDEVNYYTGDVTVGLGGGLMEGDTYTMAVGTPFPETATGPAGLVEPDLNGDANETGHVAPIQLANGSTFTEYFGIIIFGDADVGTEITATITLSLTYEYEAPLGYPVPSFTYTPTRPLFNETVTFDASASYDPDGTIVSYVWDFGDETNGTGMIVTHTYTTLGTYTVILNVTDNEGYSTTASTGDKPIAVVGLPVASFTYTPTAPTINETVTFNASASTAEGYNDRILSYEWDFDDGDIIKVVEFRSVEKYVDSTGDRRYNTSEPIYKDINQTGPNLVNPGDIRLLPPPGYSPNSTVAPDDTDVGDILRQFIDEGHREDILENGKYDNGETVHSDRRIITHNYTTSGTFIVTLNVTDTEELWTVESKSITVSGAAEFPWLWIGVGVVVIIVVVAAVAVFVRRRK